MLGKAEIQIVAQSEGERERERERESERGAPSQFYSFKSRVSQG
jgi:hypothetical protein